MIDSSYLQLNDLTHQLIFPMLAGEPPPAKGQPTATPLKRCNEKNAKKMPRKKGKGKF